MSSIVRLATFILKKDLAQLPKSSSAVSAASAHHRVGAVFDNGHVLDISRGNIPGIPAVSSMVDFISLGHPALNNLRSAISTTTATKNLWSPADISLLAPIPIPHRNLICVGKNYLDHIAEVKAKDAGQPISSPTSDATALPKYPTFFTKAPHCVIAPGDSIESHAKITKYLDYEVELAVIIGTQSRDLTKDTAMDAVYGFTTANDVTARDLQRQHNQWFKGKTLDTTCPMGPFIIPKEDLPNYHNLSIQLWLNGQLMQNSNTNKMIFDVPSILQHLSAGFTLRPGDVILTGTPEGVGYARNPPVVLRPGDIVKIEIEGLGVLENPVVA